MGVLPPVLEEAGREALARAHVAARVRRCGDVGTPGACGAGGVRSPTRGRLRRHRHAGRARRSCASAPTSRRRRSCPAWPRARSCGPRATPSPNSGSDLASLRTRAVLDGDEWVIDGQKTFCTAGHHCNWMIIAARTDPDASKRHKGISYFLSPMDVAGHRAAAAGQPGRRSSEPRAHRRAPRARRTGCSATSTRGGSRSGSGSAATRSRRSTTTTPAPRRSTSPDPPATAWVLDQLVRYCRTTTRHGRPARRRPRRPHAARRPRHRRGGREGCCGTRARARTAVHLHQAITKEFQPEFAQTVHGDPRPARADPVG